MFVTYTFVGGTTLVGCLTDILHVDTTINLSTPEGDKLCYVTVSEWSQAPVSFFCVRSSDSPGFKPSHGARRQATLVADGDFGHGPQHRYLLCLGRVSLLHEQCSKNE